MKSEQEVKFVETKSDAIKLRDSQDDKRFILKVIRYTLQFLLLAAAVFLGIKIFPFLLPIFFGLIIARSAVFFSSQLQALSRKIRPQAKDHSPERLRRRSIIIYFLLFIMLMALIAWAFTALIHSLQYAAKQIPKALSDEVLSVKFSGFLASIDRFIDQIGLKSFNLNVEGIMKDLAHAQKLLIERLPLMLTATVNGLGKIVGSLPMASLIILITIMSGYYFISQGHNFYKLARRVFPDKIFVRQLMQLMNAVIFTLFRIVGGYLLIFLIVFFQAWLGLTIIKMPNAVLWSVIIAFVDMLPVLGIAATMIPMSIYLFLSASSWQGLLCLLIMVLMWISRRFFEPLVLGGAMSLHPLLAILSMIIGIKIYGLGGVLLGPTILVILREIAQIFNLGGVIRENLKRIFAQKDNEQYLNKITRYRKRYTRRKN